MINHTRTLLLNRDSNKVSATEFGGEHVSASYRAVRLPATLQRVRRALFGTAPDTAGLNYRLRQFAPILHTAEIVDYTLAPDERITYDPFDERLFLETHTPQVTQLRGQTRVSFVIEDGALRSQTGRLSHSWRCVSALSAEDGPDTVEMPAAWGGGLSEPTLLPDSGGVSVRLGGSSMAATDAFQVTLIKRPAVDLALLPNQVQAILNEEVSHVLFGAAPAGAFATFREWWEDSEQLHFRLAGILLALAARTDNIRRHGN